MPGRIARKACTPFDYAVPETGEVIEMNYRWEYTPEDTSPPEQSEQFYTKQSETISLVENGQLQPA